MNHYDTFALIWKPKKLFPEVFYRNCVGHSMSTMKAYLHSWDMELKKDLEDQARNSLSHALQ